MRIVLIGQAAFGEAVLQRLAENSEEVVAVFCPPDPPGAKGNPLRERAESLGIPVYQPRRMRDPEVYEEFLKLQPDLNVLAFVTDIIPQRVLDLPRLGSIQYHPSILPKHRGGSAINWAVINGETQTGLTIFWPDRGIDTGPILLQREVEIGPDDTVGSLYFNKLFPLGVDALAEAVRLVREGKAPRVAQDEAEATYEGLVREPEALIDWARPFREIYNLIRGTNPAPGATTFLRGKKVKIFDSEARAGMAGAPGEVVAVEPNGFVVAAQGGAILAKRVQPEGSGKVKAPDFVQAVGLQPGDKFGA
ncbi:MAG: methionyl-tRNA formyltransferase [Chloroflexota bacterium]